MVLAKTMKLLIETIEEFNLCIKRGRNPLFYPLIFDIDFNLRLEWQNEFFGKYDIVKANDKFYRYMWENKPHYCEECLKPLSNYSSCFISHILSRGSSPEMAYDVRNINILCLNHHNQWETGIKKTMRIYNKNQETIKILKKEYASKQKF